MKKDIKIPKVEGIAVAVVHELNEKNVEVWNAYLINQKPELIEGVLVSTRGYGLKEGEKVKTSVLRHFLDEIPANNYKKIEIITDELITVSNEFWVSFYLNKKMYDKKYVFLAGSISTDHFVDLPVIGKRGVMIQ